MLMSFSGVLDVLIYLTDFSGYVPDIESPQWNFLYDLSKGIEQFKNLRKQAN
jgi:hypothetical protein